MPIFQPQNVLPEVGQVGVHEGPELAFHRDDGVHCVVNCGDLGLHGVPALLEVGMDAVRVQK
eukprot:15446656-Alexandrium_andersonii.AAC.1